MTGDVGSTPSELRRDLRLADAVAVGLGAMIGAGVFVVIGLAAGAAGPAFLLSLVVAGVAATCNALSSAQLASVYPQAGGTYEYGYRVLHPWMGFAAGWMFLASKLAAAGTVALGFGSYLAALIPTVPPRGAAIAAALCLTAANLFGIRKAGRFNLIVVAITVLGLAAFVCAGAPAFDLRNLTPFAPHGVSGVMEAAALIFFAYTGYARIATLGEEVYEPKTTIPKAILISLGAATLLYAAVAVVAVGSVGAPALAAGRAPLERAAAAFPLRGASGVVTVAAATAMLGVLLSQILGISRMFFAMARRGDVPQVLGHIHPVHAVPHRSVYLTGGVIVLIAAFGTLPAVAAAAAFTILIYYGVTNLAAMRMPREQRLFPAWVPILGLAFCSLLAISLQPATLLSGLGLLGAGFLARWVFRRFTSGSS